MKISHTTTIRDGLDYLLQVIEPNSDAFALISSIRRETLLIDRLLDQPEPEPEVNDFYEPKPKAKAKAKARKKAKAVSLDEAMEVACPGCGAEPGERCYVLRRGTRPETVSSIEWRAEPHRHVKMNPKAPSKAAHHQRAAAARAHQRGES